jgi:glycosyltransferase involved in cell wall biosynthesis
MSRIMGFIHDRLASHGHQIDYYCADDVPARWRTGLGRRFAFPLLVANAAVAAARQGRPYDIVNVHEPHALPITLRRQQAGSPAVVVTSHGLERRAWELAKEEARLGRGTLPIKTRLTYPLTSLWPASLGLRRADHVFCLNSDDREYLSRWLGKSPEDITRIFPGADLAYSRAARSYEAASRILFAAAWRDNKGIADLVPAFARLAVSYPALTLHLVGAGVPESTIRAQFPVPVRDRVLVDDPGDEAGTVEAFTNAHLFLLPSLFEGTPLTLMQAMMSGLPIVTTATCGMKDVIRNDVSGLLVPVRSPDAIVDAVARLISDDALRRHLGQTARAQALAHYTWEDVAVPVEEVYANLAGKV